VYVWGGAKSASKDASMAAHTRTGPRWPNLLLVIPFVALLWVPFYNRLEPAIWGIPFFYWYQFLWVLLTSLLILLVHRLTADPDAGSTGGRP
jgi:Protein of unknown function (DUF3311)